MLLIRYVLYNLMQNLTEKSQILCFMELEQKKKIKLAF